MQFCVIEEDQLKNIMSEGMNAIVKAQKSIGRRKDAAKKVDEAFEKLSETAGKNINKVYNRICGLRDKLNDGMRENEKEIQSKNRKLGKRALQYTTIDSQMHDDLATIERNLLLIQSTAREYLALTHKYMSEMSIGEIQEQVEETNVRIQIVDRILTERSRLLQSSTSSDVIITLDFDEVTKALKERGAEESEIQHAKQFLAKMHAACKSLQQIQQVPCVLNWKETSFYNEANGLCCKLNNFIQHLIIGVNKDRIKPVSIVEKLDNKGINLNMLHYVLLLVLATTASARYVDDFSNKGSNLRFNLVKRSSTSDGSVEIMTRSEELPKLPLRVSGHNSDGLKSEDSEIKNSEIEKSEIENSEIKDDFSVVMTYPDKQLLDVNDEEGKILQETYYHREQKINGPETRPDCMHQTAEDSEEVSMKQDSNAQLFAPNESGLEATTQSPYPTDGDMIEEPFVKVTIIPLCPY